MNKWSEIGAHISAQQWPRPKSIVAEGNNKGLSFKVETNEEGVIIFSVTSGYISKRVVSRPILIDKPGRFYLVIRFNSIDFSISIKANNVDILKGLPIQKEGVLIKTTPYTEVSINFPNLAGVKVKDESEQFFLRTIHDLLSRFNSTDEYEVIKSASLLRLLLLDNPCLIDLINRKYKLKIIYRALDSRATKHTSHLPDDNFVSKHSLYSSQEDAHLAPPKNRNAFLNIPCGTVDGRHTTVEDVIIYSANKIGGVHYEPGDSNKPKHEKVIEINSLIGSGNESFYKSFLSQIIFIVLQATEPLINLIIESDRNSF